MCLLLGVADYCCDDIAVELQMGFQDVHFLTSSASFYATCLKTCGGGEGLGSSVCLRTVVGGRQGHAPCEIFFIQ